MRFSRLSFEMFEMFVAVLLKFDRTFKAETLPKFWEKRKLTRKWPTGISFDVSVHDQDLLASQALCVCI